MHERMHLCVYVDLCIYEFVSVSNFNQMQILTKLDTMLRHCRTHNGKIYVIKKIVWCPKFCGARDKNNPQPAVSSDTDNISYQSSDI